jgi:hypothetical protein
MEMLQTDLASAKTKDGSAQLTVDVPQKRAAADSAQVRAQGVGHRIAEGAGMVLWERSDNARIAVVLLRASATRRRGPSAKVGLQHGR